MLSFSMFLISAEPAVAVLIELLSRLEAFVVMSVGKLNAFVISIILTQGTRSNYHTRNRSLGSPSSPCTIMQGAAQATH
jgi:hypothetical protein